MLRLNPESVYLIKEQPAENFSVLTQTGPVIMNTWHWIDMAAQAGHIQVYVDQALWIDFVDPAPLSRGTISMASLDGSRVEVDNVLVAQINGSLPSVQVQAPPPIVPEQPPIDEIEDEVSEIPLEEVEIEEQTPEMTVEGGLPDLVITEVVFSPDPVVQGQPFEMSYVIQNQGNAPAGAFTVHFHFHAASGLADCNADFPSLGAGQVAWGGCTRTTNSQPGTSPTELTVDIENEIAESNEDNNTRNQPLTVGATGGSLLPAPVGCGVMFLSSHEFLISWNIVRTFNNTGESPKDTCAVDVATNPYGNDLARSSLPLAFFTICCLPLLWYVVDGRE